MNVPLPIEVIKTDRQWNLYLCKYVPALDKLWKKGKYEQFEEFKLLSGLDFEVFMKSHSSQWVHNLSAQIVGVQPMTEPTGEIFKFKTKNNH